MPATTMFASTSRTLLRSSPALKIFRQSIKPISRNYHLVPSAVLSSPVLDWSFLNPATRLIEWGSTVSEWVSETILRAVPKKKVSHSRKRMRSAHKGLKPDLGLTSCPACGQTKRKHHLCLECYADKVLESNRSGPRPWDKGITP